MGKAYVKQWTTTGRCWWMIIIFLTYSQRGSNSRLGSATSSTSFIWISVFPRCDCQTPQTWGWTKFKGLTSLLIYLRGPGRTTWAPCVLPRTSYPLHPLKWRAVRGRLENLTSRRCPPSEGRRWEGPYVVITAAPGFMRSQAQNGTPSDTPLRRQPRWSDRPVEVSKSKKRLIIYWLPNKIHRCLWQPGRTS